MKPAMAADVTECPFKGLQPYTEADREYFFGRERDRVVIASNLIAAPLTILYGGSGVGKTSVLLAAVVPYLAAQAAASPSDSATSRLTTVTFRRWQRADFPAALRTKVLNAVRSRKENELGHAGDFSVDLTLPFDKFLTRAIDVLDGRLLFIFDQFEEYFLNSSNLAEVRNFEAELARVVNGREIDAHFLLSLREEELSKLDRFQGRIPNLLNNTLRVEHLSRDAGKDAIRKPIDRFNLKFGFPDDQRIKIQDELVEALLDKATPRKEGKLDSGSSLLAKPDGESVETPVLQILLTRLWSAELNQRSRELRLQTFNEQLGGAEKIISTFFKEVMKGLTEPEREMAARVFQFLVTQSGTKIALEPKTLANWAGLEGNTAEQDITALLDKLSSYQVQATPESRSKQQDIRIVRKVTAPNQADRYEIFHDVLGGAIKEWRTDYLQAKLAGAEKKKQRLTRTLVCILVAIAIAAGITVWGAIRASRERRLIEQRLTEMERFTNLVYAVDSSVPFFRAIMRGHKDQVKFVRFTADGKSIVTASADGTARIWDAQNGNATLTLSGHAGAVNFASFSRDGRRIVTAGADKTARLWDVSNGQPLLTLSGHADNVTYAAFTPGGLIVTASQDGTARVWNAETAHSMHELRGHTGPINNGMISDGQRGLFVSAGADGSARLWDPTTGVQLQLFNVGGNTDVKDAELSSDEKFVVTASSDKTAAVWDIADGQRLALLTGHEGVVNSASFSEDGKFIITASVDRTARLWDAKSGQQIRVFRGHKDEVTKAVFSADGAWVITISDDQTARVWETSTGKTLAELRGHTGSVLALDVNSNSGLIATASADTTARAWDTTELRAISVNKPVLTAEPSSYSGKCPVTIKFTGVIEVHGSGGRVRYQFIRSSKEKLPERELIFDSPGTKEVTDTWRLGESGFVYGWEYIKILEPQPQDSDKAEFKINCPEPSPTPTPDASPLPSPSPDVSVLTGTVLTRTGAVASNVRVSVQDMASTRLLITTTTDATGKFRAQVPSAFATYRIVVTAAGYRTTSVFVKGTATSVRIVLP